jgi:hypothetical protein
VKKLSRMSKTTKRLKVKESEEGAVVERPNA